MWFRPEAVTQAAAKIESGLADLVLAGGMESSSTQPLRMWNPNHPNYEKDKVWTVAQFIPGQQGEQVMLEGAERTAISEHVTKKNRISGCWRATIGQQGPCRRAFIGHSGIGGGKSEG